MKLYNSLGRTLQNFNIDENNPVRIYSCGPTVYDYQHIGNFRKFVFDDTLRRVLEASGYEVQHVTNITDVGHLVSDADEGEDKLEKGAAREGKTVWEIAEYYTKIYKNDAKALNILEPNTYQGEKDTYARATDFIPQQVELVEILLEKGFAYQTEQAIYFDISKLPDYGELTGQKLAEKETAVRAEVVTDNNKLHPQDFAVWFFTVGKYQNHTMRWNSPWGEGFPGWHLECSAIIHTLLGDPIEIHTGGVDHIGVHHTNEIAQTEAAYGNKLSRLWLHSEHLLVNGQKMSKSIGNVYTLKDVTKKGYNPMALRLLFLQSHYRTQANFTWEALDAAQNRLKSLYAFADLKWQLAKKPALSSDSFHNTINEMHAALNNDLNTPIALGVLSGFTDVALGQLVSSSNSSDLNNFLEEIDKMLGLKLADRPDINKEQKNLITEREKARGEQDWDKSDQLRDELLEGGIKIKDTPHGTVWARIN